MGRRPPRAWRRWRPCRSPRARRSVMVPSSPGGTDERTSWTAGMRRPVTRAYDAPMNTPPIILVPGFWLGGWAWDEVVGALRADGHEVTALTLPGLESIDADRSSITLYDHVEAIVDAIDAAGSPVVLAVHSGSGAAGYA